MFMSQNFTRNQFMALKYWKEFKIYDIIVTCKNAKTSLNYRVWKQNME